LPCTINDWLVEFTPVAHCTRFVKEAVDEARRLERSPDERPRKASEKEMLSATGGAGVLDAVVDAVADGEADVVLDASREGDCEALRERVTVHEPDTHADAEGVDEAQKEADCVPLGVSDFEGELAAE